MWKGKESLQNILVWLVPSLFVFLLSFSFIYLSYLDKDFYKLFILTFLAAGLGAGIPAWLVWYLTINREEKKREEDEKNALLVEYTKAFNNLLNSNIIYSIAKEEKGNVTNIKNSRTVETFDSVEHNMLNLIPVNNFYSRNGKDSAGSSLFLKVALVKNLYNEINSLNVAILKAIQPYDKDKYSSAWGSICEVSIKIMDMNLQILSAIVNYIDFKYKEQYNSDLNKIEMYTESLDIVSIWNKKKTLRESERMRAHVPTEKLPK